MTDTGKRETKKDLLAKIQDLTEALRRERADLINSRQRFEKDRRAAGYQARQQLLLDFLPLLDDLQRAFAAVPPKLAEEQWVRGVLQIDQLLGKYLAQLKLEPIKAQGQMFDPQTMEALAVVEDGRRTPGLVIEEITKGYLYDGQVLRPAQVKVVQNSTD